MPHSHLVADAMTRDPDTVTLGQPLSDVYLLLQNHAIHHVPVVDGDAPVGIISSKDILSLVYDVDSRDDRALRTYLDHQFTLEDAMSTALVTVRHDAPLLAAVEHMYDGSIHSVLVLDDDGALEGIVTSTDLIRTLGDLIT